MKVPLSRCLVKSSRVIYILRSEIMMFLLLETTLIILCGFQITNVKNEDIFASSLQLKKLLDVEVEMMKSLETYIKEERERLDRLTEYWNKVNRIHQDPILVDTEHPISSFHLLNRFAGNDTWVQVLNEASNFSNFEAWKKVMADFEPQCPTQADLDGAKSGIIRLQRVYKLPIDEFVLGVVRQNVSLPLSQEDLVSIGEYALENMEADVAKIWFSQALLHSVEPTVPKSKILASIGRAHAMKGELLLAVDYIRQALQIDPANRDLLKDIISEKEPNSDSIYRASNSWKDYADLCLSAILDQKEQLLQTTNKTTDHKEMKQEIPFLPKDIKASSPNLNCHFKHIKNSPLRRYKLEQVHDNPQINIVHDVVNDLEAENLTETAALYLKRARVGNRTVIDGRVGKIAWFGDNHTVVARISRRISEFTDLNTKFPYAEFLQMSNYGLAGHYEPHYDVTLKKHELVRINNTLALKMATPSRIATVLIYLNEVQLGGATVFPYLKLATKPVKNAAIFWHNYKLNGDLDRYTHHAGCPVLLGEKWVANKWISDIGQEFHRPCGLHEDM